MEPEAPAAEDPPRLGILAAFPYIKGDLGTGLVKYGPRIEILLDSGAFTAWQQGENITLDQYCSFLDHMPFRPWRYFTLDVVGDWEATRANYEAMRARGFSPVPIFTRGTPIEELHDYAKTSDLVGLGGLASSREGAARYGYLKHIIPQAPGVNMHLLGVTSHEWVKHFRPYSCDSTSWVSGQKYGRVNLYMGRGRVEIWRPASDGRPTGDFAARIARYGFDPYSLTKRDPLWYQINVMSWVDFAMDMEAAIGTRLFLAVGRASQLATLLEAQDRVMEIRWREKTRRL